MLVLALTFAATIYAMPDPALTSGATRPLTTEQVCAIKWGRDRRHVTAKMKRQVCEAYKAKNCPGRAWEIDHVVSRELGGADDVRNLFPQPIDQARHKDHLENLLHKLVCAGTITLKEAQHEIATDWVKFYRLRVGSLP